MVKRKNIISEEQSYFYNLFSTARKYNVNLRFYLGYKGSDLMAGNVIAFHKSTVYYLYSATSLQGRKVFASFAVLWKAIMDAKKLGYRFFDLFGIPLTNDP
jgi:lipid II:glycine glycyltransferase (peptidoglycan interpeptide bridge formation enzyme)